MYNSNKFAGLVRIDCSLKPSPKQWLSNQSFANEGRHGRPVSVCLSPDYSVSKELCGGIIHTQHMAANVSMPGYLAYYSQLWSILCLKQIDFTFWNSSSKHSYSFVSMSSSCISNWWGCWICYLLAVSFSLNMVCIITWSWVIMWPLNIYLLAFYSILLLNSCKHFKKSTGDKPAI